MFNATFLNMSNIYISLSFSSNFLFFTTLCGKVIGGTYSFAFSASTITSKSDLGMGLSMGSTTLLFFSGARACSKSFWISKKLQSHYGLLNSLIFGQIVGLILELVE